MRGRFLICLLVISSLTLASPVAIRAQSYRELSPSDDAASFPEFHRLPLLVRPSPVRPLPRPVSPVRLSHISRAAGMIFSGQVTAVTRRTGSGSQAIETVAITFHVERAIRGVRRGQRVTIVQWAGLWRGGQHYQVGEHLLLFLYPPSRLGLTSSVGGALGRFNVDAAGRVLLSERHLSAFAADPVLGGKARVPFSDFVQNVRRARGEE
jgi:hypothetical protein